MTLVPGLRRFVKDPSTSVPSDVRPPAAAGAADACGMCGSAVTVSHGHVADLEKSALLCACRACSLLFTQDGAVRGRYRAVPDRYLRDPSRELSAAQWDDLDIPVGLAFFLRSSRDPQVRGFYPSPAGVTECLVDNRVWEQLAGAFPLLAEAQPDVEAILISRTESGVACFLVPVDACYELAGLVRLYWRGFDGNDAMESAARFVADIELRSGIFGTSSEATSRTTSEATLARGN
jgi:hypothetical protein